MCLDDGMLAVVKVRQRVTLDFGGAVNRRKQHKIIRAAQILLQRQPCWRRLAVRFDVIGIDGLPGGEHRMVWIKDAFRAT